MSPPQFIDVLPRMVGLERLDVRDSVAAADWARVRDLVQSDLAALDRRIVAECPGIRVQPGSNQGGGAHLFVYRTYAVEPGTGIDPVVVGVAIGPGLGGGEDRFRVRGDIAGEALGDVLVDLPPREVLGWEAMLNAAREAAESLARQTDRVLDALGDGSRQG